MAKKPYKFRQARKDAKAAAKKAFPGKVKAVRKDITGKLTAEDRLALKDMADTAKKELGKKAYLSRAEYDAMRNADLEKFRQSMADEFGEYAGKKAGGDDAPAKKAPAKKAAVKKPAAAVEKKAPVKKAAVKKTAVKKTPVKTAAETPAKKATPSKTMTRAEKSAANKAAWKNMTPAERKNWSANKPGATKPSAADKEVAKNTKKFGSTKPLRVVDTPVTKGGELEKKLKAEKAGTTKRPTLADLKKNEAKGLEEAKKRVEAKGAATKPAERKKIVVDKKTSTADKPTAGKQAIDKMKADANAKAKAKSSKPKFRKIKAVGKGGVVAAVAGEVVSLAKGSTKKDFNEINRLEAKLADLTGKGKGKVTAGRQGAQQQLSQLASLASMGIVGKTRRQRMDELNRLIAKAEKANKPKELRYGKDGSSLVPGTAAYKAGSKTKPAYGTTSTGGGSTTKIDSRYTVKKGDTLSGIAKTAGVSLSELRDANPYIMKKKKYKQGSMIWSGTKVNIPKKK
jgi:LysM repeat protein